MDYPGTEVFFDKNDLIVSKTDLKGRITYANHTFLEIANYDESEVMGKAHNMIRHPNMPRGIFEMLWNRIPNGDEVFAYIVNSTKGGDHYWVLGHVTPSYENGEITGYHSTRRVPSARIIRDVIEPLYSELNHIEASTANRKEGTRKSTEHLDSLLSKRGLGYDEFMASLMREA